MSNQQEDLSIETSGRVNDGGMELDQKDIGLYIGVVIGQRNDAFDMVAIYKTKNASLIHKIQEMTKNLNELNTEAQTLKSEKEALETENTSLKTHISTMMAMPNTGNVARPAPNPTITIDNVELPAANS